MTFPDFFKTATGNLPYDYQDRLAMAPSASRLICIPTGLGKTAAVILAWLWNRVAQPDTVVRNTWPRRLIYCLPMRTLVEQTRDEAEKWIKELSSKNLLPGKPPKVIILMGGEETTPEDKDWDLYPGDNTIIIGTQDMLLSRALNRGYGMSRYRWPMHFGLLNNDALWVLDETQLMGPGVGTAAQLEAFRQKGDLGSLSLVNGEPNNATEDSISDCLMMKRKPPMGRWHNAGWQKRPSSLIRSGTLVTSKLLTGPMRSFAGIRPC
jgi:CRISPR-associated endonuclease/helicase Cas3